MGGQVVGRGIKQKEKRIMDMNNSVVIAGGIRGLNGNGKNTIKNKGKKRKLYIPISTPMSHPYCIGTHVKTP